jgi:hypothetical protein
MSGTIGDNVYRASGVIASAAGGTSWQSVETGSTFTAVAGNGYPVNTTAQACEVTLPTSPSVGDTIIFTDYARTWQTNAVTLDQGSVKFQSRASTGAGNKKPVYDTEGQSVTIVYVDATQGWIPTVDDDVTWESRVFSIDILVVGGGGSGGCHYGGGGGAGGLIYKTSHDLTANQRYNVVIGAGGAGQTTTNEDGNNGVDTTWTKFGDGAPQFTAKGGGAGGGEDNVGVAGGSAGGNSYTTSTAATETQTGQAGDSGTYGFGNDGGVGSHASNYNTGGGGGAGSIGGAGVDANSGDGGTGKDYSAVFANEGDSGWFASGGGGGYSTNGNSQAGSASSGGGTAGGTPDGGNSSAAAANTGGASGGGASGGGDSGAGGSGVICFKILTSIYTGTVTGSPATRVVGDYTIVEFTGDGSYTA